MPLPECLEKISWKKKYLFTLLESQCFYCCCGFPSAPLRVCARKRSEVDGGTRVERDVLGKYGAFHLKQFPILLSWMASSKCHGCCSDVTAFWRPWGRSEAFVGGRIKPGCSDLAPVRGTPVVLVLQAGPGLPLLTQRAAGTGRGCLSPTLSWSDGWILRSLKKVVLFPGPARVVFFLL